MIAASWGIRARDFGDGFSRTRSVEFGRAIAVMRVGHFAGRKSELPGIPKSLRDGEEGARLDSLVIERAFGGRAGPRCCNQISNSV